MCDSGLGGAGGCVRFNIKCVLLQVRLSYVGSGFEKSLTKILFDPH